MFKISTNIQVSIQHFWSLFTIFENWQSLFLQKWLFFANSISFTILFKYKTPDRQYRPIYFGYWLLWLDLLHMLTWLLESMNFWFRNFVLSTPSRLSWICSLESTSHLRVFIFVFNKIHWIALLIYFLVENIKRQC